MLSNTDSSTCTQLHGFKYNKLLSIFIWPIVKTLTGIITDQSGPGNNDNEGVLHIPPSPAASLSDCLVLYLGDLLDMSYSSTEMQSAYYTVPCWLGSEICLVSVIHSISTFKGR